MGHHPRGPPSIFPRAPRSPRCAFIRTARRPPRRRLAPAGRGRPAGHPGGTITADGRPLAAHLHHPLRRPGHGDAGLRHGPPLPAPVRPGAGDLRPPGRRPLGGGDVRLRDGGDGHRRSHLGDAGRPPRAQGDGRAGPLRRGAHGGPDGPGPLPLAAPRPAHRPGGLLGDGLRHADPGGQRRPGGGAGLHPGRDADRRVHRHLHRAPAGGPHRRPLRLLRGLRLHGGAPGLRRDRRAAPGARGLQPPGPAAGGGRPRRIPGLPAPDPGRPRARRPDRDAVLRAGRDGRHRPHPPPLRAEPPARRTRPGWPPSPA